jgi:hypothetical protein
MAKVLSLARPLSEFQTKAESRFLNTKQALCALPRGAITEVLGEPSAGRTSLAHSMLATATKGGEIAAIIDCNDAFDPASARKAGTDLGKLLWVQCGHRIDAALKATDLILHSGGFGLIILDLCDVAPTALQRIPTSYWYRFQRALENTPSVLLVLARQPLARSSSARQLSLQQRRIRWRGRPPFQIIERLEMEAISRKPMNPSPVQMEAWAEV